MHNVMCMGCYICVVTPHLHTYMSHVMFNKPTKVKNKHPIKVKPIFTKFILLLESLGLAMFLTHGLTFIKATAFHNNNIGSVSINTSLLQSVWDRHNITCTVRKKNNLMVPKLAINVSPTAFANINLHPKSNNSVTCSV